MMRCHCGQWFPVISSAVGVCLLVVVAGTRLVHSMSIASAGTASPALHLSSSATQAYQPLINLVYGDNQSEPLAVNHPSTNGGWTPLFSGRGATQVSSVYTAINPVALASAQSPQVVHVFPVSSHSSQDVEPQSSTNGNTSAYLTSESISLNSYQKPQSTYMIQPTKYHQAFISNNNKSSKSVNKSSTRKLNKSNKIINSEVMPIPMIKPHRHGATLGFNLPDQGLTLYLDINELATKPMAQNIGLKVVSHKNDALVGASNTELPPNRSNATVQSQTLVKSSTITRKRIKKSGKRQESSGTSKSSSKLKVDPKITVQEKISKSATKSKKISSTNSGSLMSPVQANKARGSVQSSASSAALANRTDIPPSASRIPATYATQVDVPEDNSESLKNFIQQKKETTIEATEREEFDTSSLPNNQGNEIDKATTFDEEEAGVEGEDESNVNNSEIDDLESLPDVDAGDEEEEDESEVEDSDERQLGTTTTAPISDGESAALMAGTEPPQWSNTAVEWTTDNRTASLQEKNMVRKQELVDNRLVATMQTLLEKSAKLIDLSADTCTARSQRCQRSVTNPCQTNMHSITNQTSTTVREVAHQLEANLILNEVTGIFESELQDIMDFSTSGYTFILPSNEAVRRLPPNLLKQWKQNAESFTFDAYLIEGSHTLEELAHSKTVLTRNKMRLHINQPNNETYTINGQRVVQANQRAPNGGLIHVINGLLYPSSDKDIIDTLKSCGRLDGFVTLAEGTGFADSLKKDGPFTVFVPSNDALQKVPDNDLELIRRNMTALKEFLMYHVAQGAFFSQDLVDGQFLPSILEGQYLQAGVRVDGCSRRLVEVNVSPLYRADIPASNGVIHVVDWILKPDDRDWCNGVILPRRR